MKENLQDIAWHRIGTSVVWDAQALRKVGPLSRALTLRQFLLWQVDGFSSDSIHARYLSEDGATAVLVAGLEAALDVQSPTDAGDWLQYTIQAAVRDFQSNRGMALIFWMVTASRFRNEISDDRMDWTCSGIHHGRAIRFSHGLWNGAQADLQRIVPIGHANPEQGAGLYLRHIS